MQRDEPDNKRPLSRPVQSPLSHLKPNFLKNIVLNHNIFMSSFRNETPGVETPVIEPVVEDAPQEQSTPPGADGSKFRVVLYDDDYHDVEEVAAQLQKATQYSAQKCWAIMLEAHNKGRAICYHGSREKCHGVARVLREIRLQCEVDCDD